MKIYTLLLFCLVTTICRNSYAQHDSTMHSIPLYWTFELGSSYLTSTNNIENRKAPFYPTASGGVYFNWNIPLCNKQVIPGSGFSIAPGVGVGISTFSINNQLNKNNGVVEIINIVGPYEYSYMQGMDNPV